MIQNGTSYQRGACALHTPYPRSMLALFRRQATAVRARWLVPVDFHDHSRQVGSIRAFDEHVAVLKSF
jgi:hypothetical protein